MKMQLKKLGLMYDWDREVATCKPDYYKWTQWLFLQLYKKGLAYKKEAAVNWCDNCATVLANEQVIDGKCWRCDSVVEKKYLSQWFLKITDYAEVLLKDIDKLEGWPDSVKTMQKNWIGKSQGAILKFKVKEIEGMEIPVLIQFMESPTLLLHPSTKILKNSQHPNKNRLLKTTVQTHAK